MRSVQKHVLKSSKTEPEIKTVREAVGVFRDPDNLQEAFEDLQSHGFMQQELSVLAGESTIQEKLGHLYKRVQKAEDDPQAPRTIFVPLENINIARGVAIGVPLFMAATTTAGVVVATGGAILDAIMYAATAGAIGAGIGSMLSTFIARHHARYLQEQIKRGGLLLWVNIRTPDMEKTAKKILLKHSAQDVHAHDIPVYNK
jgi:hypothetical protein